MLKNFARQLRESLDIRTKAKLPNSGGILLAVVVFTLFYCIFSAYIVPSDKPPEFNFQDEGGSITALSSIYLTLACGFAIAANAIHFRFKGTHQLLWLIVAAGLLFLAFDEQVQFHERFGRIVIEQIMPQEYFRNWNDVIVIMYGVIALPVGLFLLPRLLRYRLVPELFAAGFIFYAIHTSIDSTQDPATLTSIILEESAKVFSTAFLAIGVFTGLLSNIWESVDQRGKAAATGKKVVIKRFETEPHKIQLVK